MNKGEKSPVQNVVSSSSILITLILFLLNITSLCSNGFSGICLISFISPEISTNLFSSFFSSIFAGCWTLSGILLVNWISFSFLVLLSSIAKILVFISSSFFSSILISGTVSNFWGGLLLFSVFCLLFFNVLNFSSFLLCSNFDFDPNESSLIFDWSFRHILLSNNCSLKLGSELSLDIFDPI